VCQGIRHLPVDDLRHRRGLSASRRYLVAQSLERAPIAGYEDALPELGRRFHVPDQGFDGLQLAEIEGVGAIGLRIPPMFEQGAGDGCDARVVGITPGVNTLANAVNEIKLNAPDRVVPGIEYLVAGRTASFGELEPGTAEAAPVMRRTLEWRVDDQRLGLSHATRPQSRLITLSDSMPRSSTIFTATLRCSPASNGRLTVPWNDCRRDSSSSARMFFFSCSQPSPLPAMGKNTWRGNRERSS